MTDSLHQLNAELFNMWICSTFYILIQMTSNNAKYIMFWWEPTIHTSRVRMTLPFAKPSNIWVMWPYPSGVTHIPPWNIKTIVSCDHNLYWVIRVPWNSWKYNICVMWPYRCKVACIPAWNITCGYGQLFKEY